jgi:crotonobetainyl-CoA:carnitine CoA-transferase CaiB-like acyl-CoA transferase
MLQRVPTPHGEIRSQAPHWRFEKTPAEIRRGCPVLGQDTDRVFAQLPGVGQTNHPGSGEGGNGKPTGNPAGVLEGLRVIELAQGVAGPLSGMMLRRFGATVTKIEPPQGDWLRRIPPKIGSDSMLFLELNPGKQSLALDLKTASARAQLARLARDADVVISGLGDNASARLGLGYEELRRDNPRMIYCGISGWGRQGPMADLPATELAVQAMAGLTRHLGAKDGPPVRQGFDMASVATGVAATQAILAALFWRMHSGEGQRVEVSMLASAIAINQWDIVAESESVDWNRPSPGIQLESYDWLPDRGFQCADGSCLIDFLGHEEAWALFFAAIERTDLIADPRFNTTPLIRNNRRFLPALLNPTLLSWRLAELEPIVREHGGTILPALDLAQVVNHPQVRGLGFVEPEGDRDLPMIRIPFRCTEPLQVDQLGATPQLLGRLENS